MKKIAFVISQVLLAGSVAYAAPGHEHVSDKKVMKPQISESKRSTNYKDATKNGYEVGIYPLNLQGYTDEQSTQILFGYQYKPLHKVEVGGFIGRHAQLAQIQHTWILSYMDRFFSPYVGVGLTSARNDKESMVYSHMAFGVEYHIDEAFLKTGYTISIGSGYGNAGFKDQSGQMIMGIGYRF